MPDPELTIREGGPQTDVTVREGAPHTDVTVREAGPQTDATVREGALTGSTFSGLLGVLVCGQQRKATDMKGRR